MSRISLEWQIETEQSQRGDGEDPRFRRGRRRRLLRLLLLVALLLLGVGLAALALQQRRTEVRNQVAQRLQDTVKAEVAALRIGDLAGWIALQDANDRAWRGSQTQAFLEYEALKAQGRVELPGSIVAVNIDEERARVQVLETVDGLPFTRLWFYRLVDGGWWRVAPDYGFWGEDKAIADDGVEIHYREADEQFAKQTLEALVAWRTRGCGLLDCDGLPTLQVSVQAEAAELAAWTDAGILILRSPYAGLARADQPFDDSYRHQASQLLAERLLAAHSGYEAALYPHDAWFLRASAVDWLGRWLQEDHASAGLIPSLAREFGEEMAADLPRTLAAAADMSALVELLPVSLEEAALDWSDFIAWRLDMEGELIKTRAQDELLRLYDVADAAVRELAMQRFEQNAPPNSARVLEYAVTVSAAGLPVLSAQVEFDVGRQTAMETVVFRLVEQVWKRAS